MKKTMESIWDFLQIAGFVLFFWGMGSVLGFFLIFGEPQGIMDCVIGTALLLDLAAMLACVLWGIFSRRRAANRKKEEPETVDESAANTPVKHHVSYFGFLIAAALILMFLGSCFGKENSPEYRCKIMKSYEDGM